MNEDLEFCEQLELELPRSREWHRDREWGSVHDETYLTKEALLKAVESFKTQSEAFDPNIFKNAQFRTKYPPY